MIADIVVVIFGVVATFVVVVIFGVVATFVVVIAVIIIGVVVVVVVVIVAVVFGVIVAVTVVVVQVVVVVIVVAVFVVVIIVVDFNVHKSRLSKAATSTSQLLSNCVQFFPLAGSFLSSNQASLVFTTKFSLLLGIQ